MKSQIVLGHENCRPSTGSIVSFTSSIASITKNDVFTVYLKFAVDNFSSTQRSHGGFCSSCCKSRISLMNEPAGSSFGRQLARGLLLEMGQQQPCWTLLGQPLFIRIANSPAQAQAESSRYFFCLSMCSPIFNLTGLFLQPKQICTSFLSQKKKDLYVLSFGRLVRWSQSSSVFCSSFSRVFLSIVESLATLHPWE